MSNAQRQGHHRACVEGGAVDASSVPFKMQTMIVKLHADELLAGAGRCPPFL